MPVRGIRRKPAGRPRVRLLLIVASVTCVAAGLVLAVRIGWFFHRSSANGAALIHREQGAIGAAGRDAQACQHSVSAEGRVLTSGPTPEGLLEIPALGLVAPVLQGTGDAVLSEAVGHVPASVWPGLNGTTVLSAHDVTWFSRIDELKAGDRIDYVTPCRTFSYQVTSHKIVQAGYPVYNTAEARIVLDTCYPLDALYITSLRYLVYASLVETRPTSPAVAAAAGPPPPAVPAPAALLAQGLSLQQNEIPLGTLALSGSPSTGWRQTSAPLDDEAAALTAYFGLIHSAEQGEQGWWADLAPSVPASAAAAIWAGQIVSYGARMRITLDARGDRFVGARLADVITTSGSSQPGTYDLSVTETVTGKGQLVVSGFTTQAG